MLVVKKFGGSSVADKERIFNVAKRCIEDYKKGNQVVVVLSAMGKTTDGLIAQAADINPNAPKRELDMLLSTGEQVFRGPDGDGDGLSGRSGHFPECLSGGNAHHGDLRKRQIQENRYRADPQMSWTRARLSL